MPNMMNRFKFLSPAQVKENLKVKKTTILAVIMAVLAVSGMTMSANAQNPGAAPNPNAQPGAAAQKPAVPFMIVDLAAIMESHPALQLKTKEFEQKIQGIAKTFDDARKKIQEDYEAQKKAYAPSSAQFTQATEDFTKKMMLSEADAKLQGEKLKKEELELQYQFYAEIRDMIAEFATHNNVGVVFLYRSPQNALSALDQQLQVAKATNPNMPASLPVETTKGLEMSLMNQGTNAIFVNPQYDMTRAILQMVQRKYQNMSPQAGGQQIANPNAGGAPR